MAQKEIAKEEIESDGISRRQILHRAAVGSIMMAAGGGILAGCGGDIFGSSGGDSRSDVDILNFALNLEYLEAEFYTYATTGSGIEAQGVAVSGQGTAGTTSGGVQTNFTDSTLQAVVQELAQDERDHVTFLRSALGSSAVARPAINLAALGDFSSQATFLVLARAFEDVGVSAYGGAARLIRSKDLLEAAARILAAEAQHTGNIRLFVSQMGISTTSLDGKDIVPPPSGSQYFSLTTNSLSVIRTTREVLNIVYAGTGASGGFYPNGMNGAITS